MRYNMTIYVTGPSPAPASRTPDPAIANEQARRESLAISLADQRRSRTQGAASTVLTGGTRGRTQITRPTDPIVAFDPSKTDAGKTLAKADELAATPDKASTVTRTAEGNRRLVSSAGENVAAAEDIRKSLSPAEMAAFNAAQKDQNIASFRNRSRSRLGVRSSIGVNS